MVRGRAARLYTKSLGRTLLDFHDIFGPGGAWGFNNSTDWAPSFTMIQTYLIMIIRPNDESD